eukprot:2295472-Rhodomonas_salina.7
MLCAVPEGFYCPAGSGSAGGVACPVDPSVGMFCCPGGAADKVAKAFPLLSEVVVSSRVPVLNAVPGLVCEVSGTDIGMAGCVYEVCGAGTACDAVARQCAIGYAALASLCTALTWFLRLPGALPAAARGTKRFTLPLRV